jgi:hypothetical protein
MALISLQDVTIGLGGLRLLDDINPKLRPPSFAKHPVDGGVS